MDVSTITTQKLKEMLKTVKGPEGARLMNYSFLLPAHVMGLSNQHEKYAHVFELSNEMRPKCEDIADPKLEAWYFSAYAEFATRLEAHEMFLKLDENGDGVVTFEEFFRFKAKNREAVMEQKPKFRAMFNEIDTDKNGVLDFDEFTNFQLRYMFAETNKHSIKMAQKKASEQA